MSVDIEVADRIATVVLNRPEAMNAYDAGMRREIHAMWERLRADEDIHVAIITGAGEKAFCTGSDLKNTMPPKESHAQLMLGGGDPGGILPGFAIDKPVLCAINGYALGGGLELALACDIRIASSNAKMGLTEARVASVPGSGGIQRLPRTVAQSDAMLMLLTGDMVDAAEALRMGIVSKVVPQDELLASARAIAERIAANGPLAVRAIKRLVLQGRDMPLGHALEVDKYMLGLLRDTEDRIEGRRAFKEKRKPVYRGR
jgi:E-phenylitaconyl-CoA hydratase